MKKYCPFRGWEIAKIRQWLNEYASFGYKLKSWGFFVHFEEVPDFNGQYQIDVDDKDDLGPNKERREELEKLGWSYEASINHTRCHIYYHKDRRAVMPVNQKLTEYNCKKFRWTPLLAVLAMLLGVFPEMLKQCSKYPFWMVDLSREDKMVPMFWCFIMCTVICSAATSIWEEYRIHQYFKELAKVKVIGQESPMDAIGVRIPVIGVMIAVAAATMIGLVVFREKLDTRDYVEGYFSERYYQNIEEIYPFLEKSAGWGSYWMNVSKDSEEKLFDQIIERYAGYADYYGGVLWGKDEATYEDFQLTEMTDERFERLVFAEGIEGKEQSSILFVQKENDILYFRFWDDIEISILLDEIAKPAKL